MYECLNDDNVRPTHSLRYIPEILYQLRNILEISRHKKDNDQNWLEKIEKRVSQQLQKHFSDSSFHKMRNMLFEVPHITNIPNKL